MAQGRPRGNLLNQGRIGQHVTQEGEALTDALLDHGCPGLVTVRTPVHG
jgi:hypothetical protein